MPQKIIQPEDTILANYNYQLPPELIAQNPVTPRDTSKMLVIDSPNTHHHSIFRKLPELLLPGDLLVLNNTKVIPARLYGRKSTGASVEILLLEEKGENRWLALVKPGKRFILGTEIWFSHEPNTKDIDQDSVFKAKVIDSHPPTGGRILEFQIPSGKNFWQLLEEFGELPLPPYITDTESQPSQYQTVYAEKPGAIAAPTAGLHFTEELLEKLQTKGIKIGYLTLHVGIGTFRPVEIDDITNHKMHEEWLDVNDYLVNLIQETKANGGRVIAVGTTVVRALEGAFMASNGALLPFQGKTNLFIYPGFEFGVVDGLITNFHLPCSSLLMLVSAFIGRDRLLTLYEEAIKYQYRFYSFGDGMLILPHNVVFPKV